MLTLELFSYLSKIPYDAYVTQSNSDWLFISQSTVLRVDWLILDDNEQAT